MWPTKMVTRSGRNLILRRRVSQFQLPAPGCKRRIPTPCLARHRVRIFGGDLGFISHLPRATSSSVEVVCSSLRKREVVEWRHSEVQFSLGANTYSNPEKGR